MFPKTLDVILKMSGFVKKTKDIQFTDIKE